MTLTIVASIRAVPGKEDMVHAELRELVAPTRKEKGWLQYDFHWDNDDQGHFPFFKTWETRGLWQQHMNAPHLAANLQATDGAVEQFTLNEMTTVA